MNILKKSWLLLSGALLVGCASAPQYKDLGKQDVLVDAFGLRFQDQSLGNHSESTIALVKAVRVSRSSEQLAAPQGKGKVFLRGRLAGSPLGDGVFTSYPLEQIASTSENDSGLRVKLKNQQQVHYQYRFAYWWCPEGMNSVERQHCHFVDKFVGQSSAPHKLLGILNAPAEQVIDPWGTQRFRALSEVITSKDLYAVAKHYKDEDDSLRANEARMRQEIQARQEFATRQLAQQLKAAPRGSTMICSATPMFEGITQRFLFSGKLDCNGTAATEAMFIQGKWTLVSRTQDIVTKGTFYYQYQK